MCGPKFKTQSVIEADSGRRERAEGIGEEADESGNHITFPDRPLEQTPCRLHDGQTEGTELVIPRSK
jgi:hypothetical protein